MNPGVKIALIAAITILGTAFMVLGRYKTTAPAYGTFVYETDTFTGAMRICNGNGCRNLPNDPAVTDPWGVAQ